MVSFIKVLGFTAFMEEETSIEELIFEAYDDLCEMVMGDELTFSKKKDQYQAYAARVMKIGAQYLPLNQEDRISPDTNAGKNIIMQVFAENYDSHIAVMEFAYHVGLHIATGCPSWDPPVDYVMDVVGARPKPLEAALEFEMHRNFYNELKKQNNPGIIGYLKNLFNFRRLIGYETSQTN